MSLINCPECGKEISNQSKHCIYCGYPIQKIKESNSYEIILKNIGSNRPLTIRHIREINGLDIKSAMKIVDNVPSIVCSNISLEKAESIKQKLKQVDATVVIKEYDASDELIFKPNDNLLYCPRCGSSAITTGQKGFSLITGFLGSNKTVNRCGKCGWTWQPKKR